MIKPYSPNNQLDYATWTSAIQSGYTASVKNIDADLLPNTITKAMLDVYNPNSLAYAPFSMFSPGNLSNITKPPSCIFHNRNRNDSCVIADSTGYQVATRHLVLSDKEIHDVFDYHDKYAEIAITFDVPTGPMYKDVRAKKRGEKGKGYPYPNLDVCLQSSIHANAVLESRGQSKVKYLTVLQGVGNDADTWYDAVKRFPAYGFAIAGQKTITLPYVLWRILHLMKDGFFNRDEMHLHFLGMGSLKSAVLFTAIQDALNQAFPNCAIKITYDSSSSFLVGGKVYKAYEQFKSSPTSMTLVQRAVIKSNWVNNPEPFPYKGSRIGSLLTKGDFVEFRDGKLELKKGASLLLQNHNLDVHLRAIDYINQLVKEPLSRSHLSQHVPAYLLDGIDMIHKIISGLANKSMSKRTFEELCSTKALSSLLFSYKNIPNTTKSQAFKSTANNAGTGTFSVKASSLFNSKK